MGVPGPGHASIPERRAAARTAVSKFLCALFEGRSREAIGDLIGTSDTHVDRCCNPDKPPQFQLPDVLLLDDADRLAVAQLIAPAGHVVIAAPEPERADSVAAACAMMAQAGELASHLAESYRDGHVDRAEGARGAPIAERVARLALGAHRVFTLAMREGVVALRSVS